MANVKVGLGADGAQPEMIETGDNVLVCKISLSATTSVGDVLLIGKLPNGAIPVDAVFYGGAALQDGCDAAFGLSRSVLMFLASASYSLAAFRSPRRLGTAMQLSISDDARVLFDYIVMTTSEQLSVGHMGDLVVRYKMPGQTP